LENIKNLQIQTCAGEIIVIYVNFTTRRKFSLKNLEAKFEELGNRGVFSLGKMKRGEQTKIELHHNRYQGRVEIGETPIKG
jgi:hypothetical protein